MSAAAKAGASGEGGASSGWNVIALETADSISRLAHGYEATSGLLTDYVERCMQGKSLEDQRALYKLLSSQAIEDYEGYEHAATIIRREKLCHQIMQGIVAESKRTGAYTKVKPSAFREKAEHIRKTKRQVMCLRVEVDNWSLTQKLLHHHVRPSPESAWERKHRVEEFWAVYHHRSLRKDAGDASRRLEDEDDETLGAMLSRPNYGMGWESGTGMRWKVKQPAEGTLMRVRYDKHGWMEQPENTGIRCLRRNAASNNNSQTSLVDRSPSSTQGMSKSTSLPSLQKPPTITPGWSPGRSRTPTSRRQKSAGTSRKQDFAASLPQITSATSQKYLKECDIRRTVPTPLSFTTGHSTKLEAVGRDLVDAELLAMISTLPEAECVDVVDLQSNQRLTDRSLAPLLRAFAKEPLADSLARLNMARCVRAGAKTLEALSQMLQASTSLRVLDISRISVSTKIQRSLCKAIGDHPHLHEANLADTGLGGTYITKECITNLLASRSIETFNLGWNCFNAEVFTCLGKLVVGNPHIKSLCVDNCAASVEEVVTPISLFLEVLAYDKTLTQLDIAINRIDYRAALIIEDSLDFHNKLARLNLAQNPLGTLGMRSILRLLSRNWTGLMHFETDGCHSGSTGMDNEEVGGSGNKVLSPEPSGGHIFHYTNPGGKYTLNLARPYDRTLLRMLYKTSERFKLPPEKAFVNVTFTTPPPKPAAKMSYTHPAKDAHGQWEVATYGILTVTFNVQEAVEAAVKGVADSDFSGFLARHFELMRFQPGWKKVVPLFGRWKELEGRVLEQFVYINALAKDFNLSLHYLEHMVVTDTSFSNESICRLSPCIPGTMASRYLSLMKSAKLSDYLWTHKQMSALLDFNVDNPTGHYKLYLERCADYAVAERLLLLDRWEAAVDLRHARYDTSSRGNGSHFRNELYQGRPLSLRYASVAEWSLPEIAEFEFDYVSNQRPSSGTKELSEDLWEQILVEMYHCGCTPEEKIAVLRSISHNFFICSMQMRQLIGYFRTQAQRAEAFVAFYLRIVDLQNSKLFRVRFESQEEVKKLQERLGYASYFPFLQPENYRFSLDLAYSDQRLCASMLVAMSLKEKPHNIRDPEWIHADGTKDPLTLGVPRSWEHHNRCPPDGVFRGTYVCAPEDRKFELRKQLAETYGFFKVTVAEADVLWWTGLTEPPPDVLDFLEFLISRVDHVNEAFTVIDGVDGNGEITLREFEDGLRELKCHKYKGKDEKLRIGNLFRYLDPGGEGTVSLDEWQILDQLWKEFDLSIREFVQFMMLTVSDNLATCFAKMDEDGGGELSEDEWIEAVKEMGYFGPAKVVFALLDTTDDGSIELDEFMVLEKYKGKKAKA